MTIYRTLAVSTGYWKPGDDYIANIVRGVKGKPRNGDIITISEKAISTATGNIINEDKIDPSFTARFLAKYWTRIVWGYFLGPMCHLRAETIRRLRQYPANEGAKHKQVAVQYAGMLQALIHGSEGGIDGSNLPYSYVSLTLRNPEKIAQTIRTAIRIKLAVEVTILIVDTDKAYSLRNFHFTPRPASFPGIHSNGGILDYIAGRFFKLRKRATPIAIAGEDLSPEEALDIASIVNRARGFGAGRTVWDMAEKFGVSLTQTSWEMLSKIEHKPIVIVRRG